jgi:hypothetical protein
MMDMFTVDVLIFRREFFVLANLPFQPLAYFSLSFLFPTTFPDYFFELFLGSIYSSCREFG